jgi:predicted DNA-binding transcriptional regulator YafY
MDEQRQARINKIISLLAANPDGVWLRQLAVQTKIPPSSIHRYIENDLSDIVDSLGVKDDKGKYFGLRIIRIKPKIIEVIETGGIDKLKTFLELSKKIKDI